MHCSEAVLVTLNRSLGGGLRRPARPSPWPGPLPKASAGTGCMCGAVGGALMALGLFIGGTQPLRRRTEGPAGDRRADRRIQAPGRGPCCRVLSRALAAGTTRLDHCAELTAMAAALAAERILDHRPELAAALDMAFVTARDSLPPGVIKRALRCAGCAG